MTKRERRERDKIRKRKWRIAHVIHDIWLNLRSNAKRRHIPCPISLEDFTEWCLDTGYHLLRGQHRHSASIDRIDKRKGYAKGNIRILTLANNASRDNDERAGRVTTYEDDYASCWRPLEEIEDF